MKIYRPQPVSNLYYHFCLWIIVIIKWFCDKDGGTSDMKQYFFG